MNRKERRAAGLKKPYPGTKECCPKCRSSRVKVMMVPVTNFYDREVAACLNCRAIWEPLPEGEPRHADVPLMAFKDPCNNCAFRPGSPEQKDKETWKKLMDQFGNDAQFFCHKGVPLDPKSEHGFLYPKSAGGQPAREKLRFCRGYLNMIRKRWDKEARELVDDAVPG